MVITIVPKHIIRVVSPVAAQLFFFSFIVLVYG
jgi:hypothetical protein